MKVGPDLVGQRRRRDGGLGDLDGLPQREARRVGLPLSPPVEGDEEGDEGDGAADRVKDCPPAPLEAVLEAAGGVEGRVAELVVLELLYAFLCSSGHCFYPVQDRTVGCVLSRWSSRQKLTLTGGYGRCQASPRGRKKATAAPIFRCRAAGGGAMLSYSFTSPPHRTKAHEIFRGTIHAASVSKLPVGGVRGLRQTLPVRRRTLVSFGEPIALRMEAELERGADAATSAEARFVPTAEEQFLERLRRGEAAAFNRLVEERHGDVYALLYRLTEDPEEARDLTQETFLQAFRHLGNFRGDADLRTWLYRIAVNQARNRWRWWKRRRRDRTVSLDAPAREGSDAPLSAALEGERGRRPRAADALARTRARAPRGAQVARRAPTAKSSCSATSRGSATRRSPPRSTSTSGRSSRDSQGDAASCGADSKALCK